MTLLSLAVLCLLVSLWPAGSSLAHTDDLRSRILMAAKSSTEDNEELKAFAFLIETMPEDDLHSLPLSFLTNTVHWSLKARRATSWASAVPWAVFLNDVLPYAALTEPRDPWRCETLASSPLYHRLLQTKRCIVLHDGFYEWQQANGYTKPFFVKVGKGKIADASDVEAGNLIPMAGLYDCWRNPESGTEVYSYTIITTEAAPDFAHIHDRMPCILKSTNEMESWLHCAKYPFEAVKYLLRPHSGLHWYQVSPFVGNVRNNTPQCFRALDSRSQITTFFMARKDEGEQQWPPLKSEPQETTQPIAESSSETTGEICCAFNESKPLRTFEETKAQLTPSKRPPSNTSPQLAKRPRPISSFFKPKPDPK